MGAKKQTLGFRYFFSLHMGIGRGPVNQIAEIRVGDIPAYSSLIDLKDTGQLILIDRPDLFGGETKEGGIRGPMYCYNGAADQELQPAISTAIGRLPAIANSLGGDVPNFRGVVTLWYNGLVAALNPYPKEWSFRVRRWDAGWYNNEPWYPAKALIILSSENVGEIFAMNGAHMLYEVNTNPEWGRGIPPEYIDENSFIEAANTLCDEGMGLCIPWFRQESIKDFMQVIVDHIGGIHYVDRETGKLTLRLIRDDYDPDDLPLFTPDTGLLDIIDDDSSGEEIAYNEIIVVGFDPTTKEDIQVRVHNLAAIQSQGEIISNTIEYRGFSTRELCARAALRELKVQMPLRRMSVVLDRRGWRIAPGMPFRVSDPAKGIENIILRAGECKDGTLTDGKITVKAVQDVFGLPETAFITPPGTIWEPPDFTPKPPAEARMYEANWRDFYLLTSEADQDSVDVGTSYVGILAKEPEGVRTQGYDVLTSLVSGVYDADGAPRSGFTSTTQLVGDIGPLDTTLTVSEFPDEFEEGMALLIDDEQMEFTDLNPDTLEATVKRGVADTLPAAHTSGRTFWLIDDEIGEDTTEYQAGETVYGKALTRTSTGRQSVGSAPELSITVNQRVFAPYPPGDLKVNGDSVYLLDDAVPLDEPVFTWVHRDRLLQADVLVGHTEGSIGPEPGVTYNIRVYAGDGVTLLRETDVGDALTWTYTAVMRGEDDLPDRAWFEIESVRDGVASYFRYRFKIVFVTGWGYGWGENWGG